MPGTAEAAGHALATIVQRNPLIVAFFAVSSVQADHVITVSGKIKQQAHAFFDDNGSRPAVFNADIPGDNILPGENRIIQCDPHVRNIIRQS